MKSINKLFLILIIIAAGFTNLYAQSGDKVRIILSQPPPNQLGVGDMWNLELTNTTDKDIKIFLTGTATEEKDGLIIEGKSKVFTLKPGRSNYKYNDFSSAEVKYNNGRYKEIILRTGNAPEGSYTICVTAFDESGTEVGRENCIMQSVQQIGGITLLTPGDGEEIDPDTLPGLMFTWTPLPKGGPYSLRIVELKGSESKEEGIRANRPIIDKEGITASFLQYSSLGTKFTEGKKYAWQVSSGDVQSDVAMFVIQTTDKLNLENFSSICKGNGEYDFQMTVKNSNTVPTDWIAISFAQVNPAFTGTVQLTNFTVNSSSVSISPNSISISSGSYPSADMNLTSPINIGANGTKTVSGRVKFSVGSSPQLVNDFYIWLKNQTGTATPSGSTNVGLNQCNCCDGFIRKVDSLSIVNNLISGKFTAGPKPITKITAEMVYFGLTPVASKPNKPDNCMQCVSSSAFMGNFYQASSVGNLPGKLTITPPFNYSREIIWGDGTKPGINMNNGTAFSMNILMPPVSLLTSCCSDVVDICIRFTFTDTSCVTCDTVICVKINRGKSIKFGDNFLDGFQQNNLSAGGLSNAGVGLGMDSIYINEDSLMIHAKDMNLDETEVPVFIEKQKDLIRNKEKYFRPLSLEELRAFNNPVNGCDNGNFESGNFNSWTGATANHTGNGIITTPSTQVLPYYQNITGTSYQPDGYQIDIVSPGVDPIVGIPMVHSGNFAAKLGNYNVKNSRVEILRKTFTVDASTANLSFWYAIVVIDGGHNNNNPFFEVRVLNSSGTVVPGLGFKKFASTEPFWQQQGSIKYRDWSCGQIDLSQFYDPQNPQTVTVEFINGDCSPGAHWAYSYIDDICLGCAGSPTGSVSINDSLSIIKDCEFPVQICGTYSVPFVGNSIGTMQNMFLDICHNGSVITTLSSPTINTTNKSYCFSVPQSAFPTVSSPPDGFDFVVRVEFLLNGSTVLAASSTPGNGHIPGMNNDFKAFCGEPCCTNFNININSSVGPPTSTVNNTSYTLTSTISTSPNRIKEVRANIVNMYQVSQRGCQKCVNFATGYGGFGPVIKSSNIPFGSNIVLPVQTKPGNIKINDYSSPRELVWKDPKGSSRPPFNNQSVKFTINLPPFPEFSCCTDTIRFCIRYTFTDTTCRTCSKLVCYEVIQKGGQMILKPSDKNPKSSIDEHEHNTDDPEIFGNQVDGNSAGSVNLDVVSTSNYKLNIYDSKGNEILNVFDDYLQEGKYNFDLNRYNLPDGIYFYKLEGVGIKKYEKVLISNQTGGCSCALK